MLNIQNIHSTSQRHEKHSEQEREGKKVGRVVATRHNICVTTQSRIFCEIWMLCFWGVSLSLSLMLPYIWFWYLLLVFFLLVVTSVPPRICVPHMAALENFTVNIILITPSVCVQCTTNSVASQADKTSPGLGVRAESDPARTLSFKPANKGQDRQPVCLEFTTAAQAPQTSKLCFPLPLPFPLFPTLVLAVSRF